MVAWRSWLNGWLGQSIIFDLRTQLYRQLQKLSLSFYDKRQVGSVLRPRKEVPDHAVKSVSRFLPFMLSRQ